MSDRQTQIVVDIIRYLIMHPDAKDGPQGIKRWWLSSQLTPASDEETDEALKFIVAQGWLEERNVTAQQRVFAAKSKSLKSAAIYLQQLIGNRNEA